MKLREFLSEVSKLTKKHPEILEDHVESSVKFLVKNYTSFESDLTAVKVIPFTYYDIKEKKHKTVKRLKLYFEVDP